MAGSRHGSMRVLLDCEVSGARDPSRVVEMPLTRGLTTLIDEADYALVSHWKWRALGRPKHPYAGRSSEVGGVKREMFLHRHLMGDPEGLVVDHINRNTLDNRRANLRVCTKSENRRNSGPGHGSLSGFKGVTREFAWSARIDTGDGRLLVGLFATPEEAARAYDTAARIHHGEFAFLNFPLEVA